MPEQSLAPSMSLEEMIEILKAGGWVMYMLATIAIILYFTAFDLMLFTFRGNLNLKSAKRWKEWIRDPAKGKGRVGEIIRYTRGTGEADLHSIKHRFEEVRRTILARINQRLFFLKSLVAVSPLAGLLGTVIGMLTTFAGIASGGRGETMAKVAGGIKEALLTTQTGLMVALPGVFISLLIQQKRMIIQASLARLESMTVLSQIDQEE